MISSIDRHVDAFIAGYLPRGGAWDALGYRDSNIFNFVYAYCCEFSIMESGLANFENELMLDTVGNVAADSEEILARWENIVGIPDKCFSVAPDIPTRRANIRTKLYGMNLQTSADFENFAADFGVTIKARSGIDHDATNGYGTELPDITFSNAKEARFTLVITIYDGDVGVGFPYTFPFPFADATTSFLDCVFSKLVPANVTVYFIEG